MKKILFLLVAAALVLATAAIVFSADVNHGKEVYAAQNCKLCHSIDKVGNPKYPLDGVGAKLNAEQTKKWIVTPKEMDPKTIMKAYPNLPAKDLDDLVAYMQSLKK